MKLKYWTNFSKRKNSTLRPNDLQATEIDIRLKDDCSVINPVIQSSTIPIDANYFYIPDFGRYYFLDNTERTSQQLKDHSTEVDVLATFKDYIGSSSAQISYASSGWNKDLIDNRAAIFGSRTVKTVHKSTVLISDGDNCYIIGIINNSNDGKHGAVSYYIMNDAQLQALIAKLTDSSIVSQLQQQFTGDWMQLIVSCVWLPIPHTTAILAYGGVIGTITVGGLNFPDVTCSKIGGSPIAKIIDTDLTIPKIGDFRDLQPYTSASLYLPGVGLTDLNINDFYNSTSVKVKFYLDCVSGEGLYQISNDNNQILKSVIFDAAMSVALAHTVTGAGSALMSVGGMIGGIAGVAVSAATGNAVGAAVSGLSTLAAAGAAVAQCNQRSTSVKGSNGGRAEYVVTNIILTLVVLDTEDVDSASYIARWGRPVGEVNSISSHSGYIQCDNASVSMPGTATEKDRVNSYLNNGFFYE